MAAIYDKALKRKDVSGTIQRQHSDPNADPRDTGDIKSSADVGKIVNLMAGDASRISGIVNYMYFIYQCK